VTFELYPRRLSSSYSPLENLKSHKVIKLRVPQEAGISRSSVSERTSGSVSERTSASVSERTSASVSERTSTSEEGSAP
jgi:hypothetical protein